ncbi:MAG: molybdenum cofactor biosynthesis protein MoaE [Rubrivivax sp.]|nr:MAG: molybdenum cofactor biosynthesis protein MoaE [Rubrivivax sp.]
MSRVSVQTEDFDLSTEVARLRSQDAQIGAVVSFVGTVRAWSSAQTQAPSDSDACLELEHYPGMTESAIEAMIDEASRRFDLRGARVIHRVGRLPVGAQIVLVVTASGHRGQAFAGCEFLMDWLKTEAPFWKKEISSEGERWVEAKPSDDEALARWQA